MSDRKPNLNQIFQSQKLLNEAGSLQSVIGFLHNQICISSSTGPYGPAGLSSPVSMPRQPVHINLQPDVALADFKVDLEKITVEQLEKISIDIQVIQKKILEIVTEASVTVTNKRY